MEEQETALKRKFDAIAEVHDRQRINMASLAKIEEALNLLRAGKPEQAGELARRYAITITELEKVLAYFKVFVAY